VDSNDLKLVQVLALRAVEEPTYEDFIRRVQRWYSKNFHVSLNEVEHISDQELLRVYLEEQYLELYESDDDKKYQRYQDIRTNILNSFDDTLNQAESEDDDWEAKEVAAAEQKWEKELNSIDTSPKPVAKQEMQVPNLTEDDSGFVVGEDTIPEK
jgi:hypothetical protein